MTFGLFQVSNTFPLCHVHFAAGQHCGEDVLQGPMQVLRAERGQRCAGPHRTKGRSLHLVMKGSCARPVPTTAVVGDVQVVLRGDNGDLYRGWKLLFFPFLTASVL